ncbi:hypothetical protein [Brucella anthropi]|uniref:hypothetical protein n=1 Tax=Brucella anthropi TaxID=529 RepID=UPI00320B4EB6
MATLAEIRQQYPQYGDLSDEQLADGLYKKHYSDMPRDVFNQKIGLTASPQSQAPDPSVVEDVTKSGAAGLARGSADLVGLPGSLGDILNQGAGFLLKRGYQLATGEEAKPGTFFGGNAVPESVASGQAMRGYASKISDGATDYQAQTTPGKYAGTVGEFLPGTVAFGGANPSNLLRYGVVPAVASEAAGQATKGSAFEPYARVGAAIAAPMGVGLLSKVVSPNGGAIDALRSKQIQTLEDAGVPLTAGQITGNKRLAYAENMNGGQAAQNVIDDQAKAFTDAAMRKAGGSGLATPDALAALQDELGQGFNAISARNSLSLDKGMVTDISKTMDRYGTKLDALKKPVFDRVRQDIVNEFKANKGTVSGEWYQQARSDLSQLAQSARGNDNLLSDAFTGLRNSLDDAMERSISKTNPSDLGVWKDLRRKWGNFRVVADASNAAGEAGGGGIISPARLAMAAKKGKNGLAFATGKSDFTDLVKAGQSIMTPLPNSGTAQRIAPIISGGAGSAIGSVFGGPVGAAAGAIAGAFVPKAGGALLMSKPVQTYLANQIVGQTRLVAPQAAPSAALEYSRRFAK